MSLNQEANQLERTEQLRTELADFKIKKIDKRAVDQARQTPPEKAAENKRRLDQLLVKKYVRTQLGPSDPNFSDPEDGDAKYKDQLKHANKEKLIENLGRVMPEQHETEGKTGDEKRMRNANSIKYATINKATFRKGRKGTYDLDIAGLEAAIARVSPKKERPNSFFNSPSREYLNTLSTKHVNTLPAPNKY